MEKVTGTGIVNALIVGFIIGVGLGGFVIMANGLGPLQGFVRVPTIAGPGIVVPAAPGASAVARLVEAKAAPQTAAIELKVTATDLKFTPNQLTAKVGQPIKVVLENKGVIEHDISFQGKLVGGADQKSAMAKPGQTVTLEFTPTAKGKFEFVCTVPGHKEAGMKGTITVE
jgi:uncharacterized cupredoxin-like copper-binding protein